MKIQQMKVPPHNIEAEQAILGALFMEPSILPQIQTRISAEEFYREAHAEIFSAMERLHKASYPIDAVTVSTELNKSGKLEMAGGIDYLAVIIQGASGSVGWKYYAEEIKDNSIRRKLIMSFLEAYNNLFSKIPTNEILSKTKKDIVEIEVSDDDIQTVHISKIVPSVLETKTEKGISSGFYGLDKVTMGWQGGDLIIIAGRPGMGKSVFSKDCAEHSKVPTLYFSLEMSKGQLIKRQLSGVSGVDHDVIRSGKLKDYDWEAVINAAEKLNAMPIYYNDSGKTTIGRICAISETYKMTKGIGLVIVDYLQLIRSDIRGSSREQEVSSISRELKLLARSLDIPVICLAQLNRGCEARKPPIPVLSDLRESGAIEQDADFVGFLYRPWMYDNTKDPNEAHLYLAKGRNTRTGKIDLIFRGENQVFQNPWRVQ